MPNEIRKKGLQRKIFIMMILVGVLPGVVGVTSIYFIGKKITLNSAGPGLEGTSDKAASQANTMIQLQLRDTKERATERYLVDAVWRANERHASKEAIARLKKMEAEWGTRDAGVRKALLGTELSAHLLSHEEDTPELYCRTVLVDAKGYLVAASRDEDRFNFSGETWWQDAMGGKAGIGLGMCPQGGIDTDIMFSVPVLDRKTNQPIGALSIQVRTVSLFFPLGQFSYGETGHLDIINSSGSFILEPFGMHRSPVPRQILSEVMEKKKGWLVADDEHGRKAAVGFSPIDFDGWHVLLSQDLDEIYAPLDTLLTGAALPGFLTVILLAAVWFHLSKRVILNPISKLNEGAYMIGHGHLEHRLDVSTGDELESLSDEFNVMAGNLSESQEKLKRWNDELRSEVARRTEELEEANEELTNSKEELQESLSQVMSLNEEIQTSRMELSRRNEELAGANLKLREIDRLKSEFLANMSHELRTPLTAIIGFSELMIDRVVGELNEEQAGCVDNILTSGQHLLKLINDILDLSKIEAGRMDLHLDSFRAEDAVNFVKKTIAPLVEKKRQTVNVRIGKEMPDIFADPGKVRQLLLNLVGNAVKFTPEGGSITIEVDFIDNEFIFSVTDTGIGIRLEDRERVFLEFQQAEGSTSREYGGTGLGLALTKRLTEMHGGRIELRSEEGKGSTFIVHIPFGKDKRLSARPEFSGKISGEMKTEAVPPLFQQRETFPTILVIEDDPKLSKLLSVYLIQAGYHVETAMDGEEAVKKAVSLQPFAITLDIMLPKKDGWEVLQELKVRPETKNIPVIIVSMVENQELGFSLGAVDYLAKPISREDLLGSLQKYSFRTRVSRGVISILVVDDDPKITEFLTMILKKEGFHVTVATEGEEAINLALEQYPDMIVLDLMMPKVSGFEVIRELKKHNSTKDIPILVLTAKDLTETEMEMLKADACKVVQKGGISKEDLVDEVKKMEILHPERAGLIDGVTGLFNHRYFINRLNYEINRAMRYERRLSVSLIALDHFSRYNEINGYGAGDNLLRDVSRILTANIRKADVATRYSGGKFALLLPEVGKEYAFSVCEKLLHLIEEHPFDRRSSQPAGKVTVSISVASYPEDGEKGVELIDGLEEVLRRIVDSGGNMVKGVTEGHDE